MRKTFSLKPIPLTHWQLLWKRALRYLPWRREEVGSVKERAAPLIDLFASIVMRDKQMSEKDVDIALDFLRYSFPEAEHTWLARYFQKATETIHPVSQLAVIAGTNRSLPARMEMALEVLALLANARDEQAIKTLFPEVMLGLMLPGASEQLQRYLQNPLQEPPDPIISVRFSVSESAEVRLSEEDKDYAFRVLHCGDLLLLLNDSLAPLKVRGRSLPEHSMIALSAGQVISLPSGTLSYADLISFVHAKKTGAKESIYLFLEEGALAVERNKTRLSLLKVTFGLQAEVEVVRSCKAYLNDTSLELGKVVSAYFSDTLSINGVGPFEISQLQNRTEDLGKRFYVDPTQRTVRVSNIPAKIGAGDVLLTHGLAGRVYFEVTFSHNSKSGVLKNIECEEALQVNGRVVRHSIQLQEGDLIRISFNQSLRCRFKAGILEEERNVIHELSVEGLNHSFNPGVRVLDNIDFRVRRGEMVCILGPSGCGKSTLLSALAGHIQPENGSIKYNGLRLYNWLSRLVPLIAHIPRQDILNPYQTVEEHLSQATTIRRSRLSGLEKKRRVYALLKYLGLTQLAKRRVGSSSDKHLSDGERTRLNLGLDMGGIADVFLMDEPISGLSSRDSENVLETLENMSKEKIVIVTLHRPSAHLLNRFQKVLLLDHGGQMAFWGSPSEMLEYFRQSAQDLGIVVSADSTTAGGADYVFEVLESPLLWQDKDKQHARLWQERFENYSFRGALKSPVSSLMGPVTKEPTPGSIPDRPPRSFKQLARIFGVWMARTGASRLRSRTNLYTALLEAPILASVVAFSLRSMTGKEYIFEEALHISPYLFLAGVVAMFFGLMAGATEILKDKPLLFRERNVGVFYTGYLGAKALVLTLVATVQCALFLLVGNSILEIHELFLPFLGTMVLTSFVGISLSLLVSLLVKTERAALNAVPLLLVPQILFAGALIPFEQMNHICTVPPRYEEGSDQLKPGRVPYMAELCPLRYSYEAMLVTQAIDNPYDSARKEVLGYVEEMKKHSETLTKSQVKQMRLFLQFLSTIPSLEAPNAKEADYALRRLKEAALANDSERFMLFLDKFMTRHEGSRNLPLSAFFVNKRLSSQFDYAEALRINREQEDRPEIYLSGRKPVPFTYNNTDKEDILYTADKNTLETPWYNDLHLFLMGFLSLIVTGFLLRKTLSFKVRKG